MKTGCLTWYQVCSGTSPKETWRPITHLKPPTVFDLDVSNVAHSWKPWREDIELYMEEMMVKLFLYIIGCQGREIYETLSFDKEPEEQSFKDIVEAFSNYCDPKKNETVERYKFFTRVQEVGETLDRFITDVKILAAMYHSGCKRIIDPRPNNLWHD